MSARRILAGASVVAIAALSAPAALAPGINSADLICILSPFALVAVYVGWRSKSKQEGQDR